MNKIIALTDYKNRFGSKHFDVPYRSGFNKKILKDSFEKINFNLVYIPICDYELIRDKSIPIVYPSSEDKGFQYKSYIEDVIYTLENSGFRIIPSYTSLKANNNKVLMEMLRKTVLSNTYDNIWSKGFGTFEDLKYYLKNHDLQFPVVIKKSEGASGKGVYKADKKSELFKIIKKLSRTRDYKSEIKDSLRAIKHGGYRKESKHRRKFILQEFIPDLKNDWKVYVFGSKYYIFNRPILKHRGFRASGGGYDNYYYGEEALAPDGIFDFAKTVFDQLKVPHASFDVAFNGNEFFLIEYQMLYFGTAGIPYSNGYFTNNNTEWLFVSSEKCIEEAYAESIAEFLDL